MSEEKGLRALLPPEEQGYTYGTLLPFRRKNTPQGGLELAVPRVVRDTVNSAWDAFTAPGDVLTGYRKPTPEMAANFAANVAGIGALRNAPRIARAADEAVLGQRVSNRVVPAPNPAAKTNMLEGRVLNRPEQVKYAQRKMSTDELEDALKNGRFKVPESGTKFNKSGSKAKWWSAADDEGIFGRPWDRRDTHLVRLPISKVPEGRAAKTKYAEVWDSAIKEWVPFSHYTKKYAIGGVVIDDGNPAKRRKLI